MGVPGDGYVAMTSALNPPPLILYAQVMLLFWVMVVVRRV